MCCGCDILLDCLLFYDILRAIHISTSIKSDAIAFDNVSLNSVSLNCDMIRHDLYCVMTGLYYGLEICFNIISKYPSGQSYIILTSK